jgi:hypothetical protein
MRKDKLAAGGIQRAWHEAAAAALQRQSNFKQPPCCTQLPTSVFAAAQRRAVHVQRGVDYEPLRAALKEKDFLKADDIHRKRLIEVAGEAAQERGWVYFSEVWLCVYNATDCSHGSARRNLSPSQLRRTYNAIHHSICALRAASVRSIVGPTICGYHLCT